MSEQRDRPGRPHKAATEARSDQKAPSFTQYLSGPGATGANVAHGNAQGNQGMRYPGSDEAEQG